MARQGKRGLDYFPHVCILDDSMNYIIALHQSNGYYIYFKLLEHIYSTNGYYCEWNKKNIVLFANKISIKIDLLNDIIDDMLEEKLFSKSKLKRFIILTSKSIQKTYAEATLRRKTVGVINDYLLIKSVDILTINANIIFLNVDKSTQSKVKESKEDKSIYNEFYSFEIENSNNDDNYIKFVKILFGENNSGLKLKGVLKIENQLTYKQFGVIYNEKQKNKVSLTTVLENLENRSDLLKKYSTLQRVLLNWMKTNKK